MPINEESKQAYLQARDVFVDSYKDYLHKLLGLLMEAEQSTSDADVRRDVAHFADEVKLMQSHINDYLTEEELAKKRAVSASSSGTPRGGTSQEDLNRASSPGESPESPTPVPLLGTAGQTTTSGSDKSPEEQAALQKQKSTSQSKSASRDESADELQAEVESQPSQLSPTSEESAEEMPEIMPPPLSDDGRVVSAFCAFRYHKDEFRQLFLRPQQQQQGSNSCNSEEAADNGQEQ